MANARQLPFGARFGTQYLATQKEPETFVPDPSHIRINTDWASCSFRYRVHSHPRSS